MFIATHKKIAACAYDMLNFSKQNLIDKNSFIEGSYFPDTNIKYTMIIHDFEHTIGIVDEKIAQILSQKLSPVALGKKLGIISHFIADYCSPYHTNEKYNKHSLVKHLAYEKQTNDIIDEILKNFNRFTISYPLYFNTLTDDLKSFIQIDMQGQKSMEKEVTYAVVNTKKVLNLIMDKYIDIHYNSTTHQKEVQYKIPSADYYNTYNISDDGMYEDAEYM